MTSPTRKTPQQPISKRSKMIAKAVSAQTLDIGLWSIPAFGTQPISEAYLQESLRDLHRVIEDGDEQALKRIIERLNP